MDALEQEADEWREALQVRLGYRFQDGDFLAQALTHRSHVHENLGENDRDNERLEFLGDAILNAVISHALMERFSDRSEGDLTRIRASIVNGRTLSSLARRLGLGRFVFLGRGEDLTGGREKTSILAACYEALVGAVYLDGGYEAVRRMVESHFLDTLLEAGQKVTGQDFKTLLQQETQRRYHAVPRYAMVRETGPDHEKIFQISVSIEGLTMGQGAGKTKKEAEQRAAHEALDRLMTGGP
jgi:ribonuclease-3